MDLHTLNPTVPPEVLNRLVRALPGLPAETVNALAATAEERGRQDGQWGEQNHRDGTGPDVEWSIPGTAAQVTDQARKLCQRAARDGNLTWLGILREETAEALGCADPGRLYEELVQVAGVANNWAGAIERRLRAQLYGRAKCPECRCDPVSCIIVAEHCITAGCNSCVEGCPLDACALCASPPLAETVPAARCYLCGLSEDTHDGYRWSGQAGWHTWERQVIMPHPALTGDQPAPVRLRTTPHPDDPPPAA